VKMNKFGPGEGPLARAEPTCFVCAHPELHVDHRTIPRGIGDPFDGEGHVGAGAADGRGPVTQGRATRHVEIPDVGKKGVYHKRHRMRRGGGGRHMFS